MDDDDDPATWSTKRLKAKLTQYRVPTDGMDKRQLVERLRALFEQMRGAAPPGSGEDVWSTPPSGMCSKEKTLKGEGGWKQVAISRRELNESYAEALGPEKREDLNRQCVWGYEIGGPPPAWWRLPVDDDDTYAVLELAMVANYRPWQPCWEDCSFYRFIEGFVLPGDKESGGVHDGAARRLVALDKELRNKARDDALRRAIAFHKR